MPQGHLGSPGYFVTVMRQAIPGMDSVHMFPDGGMVFDHKYPDMFRAFVLSRLDFVCML